MPLPVLGQNTTQQFMGQASATPDHFQRIQPDIYSLVLFFFQKNIKAQINRLISSAQDIVKRRCVMDPKIDCTSHT